MVYTKIYNGDSLEVLPHIRNNYGREIVDLIITSPPYNVGIEYASYDDTVPYDSYLKWMKEIWTACYDSLRVGGRICVNIPITKQIPNRCNIYLDLGHILQDIGFKYRDNVIWYKQNISKRTAWGSWASPSDPYMVNPYEAVLIFHKLLKKHKSSGNAKSDITDDEFKEWTNSWWQIQPETRLSKKHPAPFPTELPRRLIKFYSYPKDTVLDPFLGSGTTTLVARELGRNGIGIELNEGYTKLALDRTLGEDNHPEPQSLDYGILYEAKE